MYDSKMTVSDVISTLKNEVDIASDIPEAPYIRWISSLEQLLYSDIIRFYRSCDVAFDGKSFEISSLPTVEGQASATFDDIAKIYCGPDEVVKCGAIAAYQFEDDKAIYWQEGDTVKVRTFSNDDTLHVIVRVRPSIKTLTDTVKVPYEWLDMVLSKVRGEAYKIAGDDAQAAKWLNDYNVQLESFKAWCAERQKWFGE